MTKKKRFHSIGIIAEDRSDVDSTRVLINKITCNNRIGIKSFVGKGCGKLKKKCSAWAGQLKERGCYKLILIHDLDRNDIVDLRIKIDMAIYPCPINKYLICIPVQELEAWLLSDPDGIKDAMKLRKAPKVKGLPENIDSPKEYLGKIIHIYSDGEIIYINTKHNQKIAHALSIDKAKRCPSFSPFHDFLQLHCK